MFVSQDFELRRNRDFRQSIMGYQVKVKGSRNIHKQKKESCIREVRQMYRCMQEGKKRMKQI